MTCKARRDAARYYIWMYVQGSCVRMEHVLGKSIYILKIETSEAAYDHSNITEKM
jgi:hypothetical protein